MKFLILSLFIASFAHAAQNENEFSWSRIACAEQVQTLLNHWEIDVSAPWKKQIAADDTHAWKTHGKELGEWVSLVSDSNLETTLVHSFSNGQIENTHFKKANCELTKVEGRSEVPIASNPAAEFTDSDLKKNLTAQKNGLIYLWSPNMSLSMSGISEMKKAASDLGLPMRLVMDPLADAKLASEMAKKLDLPEQALMRMKSRELAARSVTLHYPALVVYRDGKICNQVQRGYRDHEHYRKIATEIFGDCQ